MRLRGRWIVAHMLFRGGHTSMGEKWHLTLKQTAVTEYRLEIRRTFLVVRSMGSESVAAVEQEMDQV